MVKVSLSELKTICGFNNFIKKLDLPNIDVSGWFKYISQRVKKLIFKIIGKA